MDEFIRPNTARWDEAKVLVDLVSFKVSFF